MNRKTPTLACRSPVRTRPLLLPGSRAPDAAGGSHGADGPTRPAPPPEAHHRGGQHHVRVGAPNSRSLAPLARTHVRAPPAFGLTAPARPSGGEIPARMAGDSSASQHLLLKWKDVHKTGSTPKLVFSVPPHRPTPNFAPSWNVAPTDPLPVVRYDARAGERSLDVMRWGLVPFWAKDIKVGFANINAKAEGIEGNPAFREAFQRRRCLAPVECL